MPISDRGSRLASGLRSLAATAILLCLLPANAASERRETIVADWGSVRANYIVGTLAGDNLVLRQGSTLLKASKAEATGLVDGKYDNSSWKLTGVVHLEFDGAILDTRSATIVFAGGALKTVQAQPGAGPAAGPARSPVHLEFNGALLDAQTAQVNLVDNRIRTAQVQGSQAAPAQFSHQFRNAKQRAFGRALRVDYDATKSLIRFSGNTKYSYGNIESETESATYNMGDGSFTTETPSTTTLSPDERPAPATTATPREERVPPPSTPNRATAK